MSAITPTPPGTMRALVVVRDGSSQRVQVDAIAVPSVPDDGVLVRMHACALTIMDRFSLTRAASGSRARVRTPHRVPPHDVLGRDFAGTVTAVGTRVPQFAPGDAVFGAHRGAFAKYVCVPEAGTVIRKPTQVTFEQAAAVPLAGLTALQAVRDHGRVQSGQPVVINGASGGGGTFTVQLAKACGATVTGVCRARNVDLVRALGAAHVIDYTEQDFTQSGLHYDVLLDIAGNRSWSDYRRILAPRGIYVAVGAAGVLHASGWRALRHFVTVRVASVGGGRKVVLFLTQLNRADRVVLRDLLEAGRITAVIDRTYPLREAAEAMRYLGAGHARGKVVLTT
jgi:NADPH:quinone reductase-like Zn-dependent oxidoreductase